jgi:hypothetical protein
VRGWRHEGGLELAKLRSREAQQGRGEGMPGVEREGRRMMSAFDECGTEGDMAMNLSVFVRLWGGVGMHVCTEIVACNVRNYEQ